jgi:hypothetical protein
MQLTIQIPSTVTRDNSFILCEREALFVVEVPCILVKKIINNINLNWNDQFYALFDSGISKFMSVEPLT